jgi:hypothetical protein
MIKLGLYHRVQRVRQIIESVRPSFGLYLRPSNDNHILNDQEHFSQAVRREMAGLDLDND